MTVAVAEEDRLFELQDEAPRLLFEVAADGRVIVAHKVVSDGALGAHKLIVQPAMEGPGWQLGPPDRDRCGWRRSQAAWCKFSVTGCGISNAGGMATPVCVLQHWTQEKTSR